jgi:hypothetical protein
MPANMICSESVAFSSDGREVTVIAEGVQTHHLIVTAKQPNLFFGSSKAPDRSELMATGNITLHQ